MKRLSTLLLFIFLVQVNSSFASHLIGYDMNMINIKDASGNPTNNYKFRLRFYREPTGISLPNSFNFTIKANGTNAIVGTFNVNKINPQTFIRVAPNGCPLSLMISSVELGIYESSVINLSSYNNVNGYYVYNSHVARNLGIKNVFGSSDAYGIILTMEFPALNIGSATQYNSSPVFNNLPVTYCYIQTPINIALNTIDPDGDSLAFSLVQPLDKDIITKPFATIPYASGYGLNSNILDGNPDITINNSTGNIFFKPTQLGKYLIAFKCEEYRNSIKIGEIRREIQLEVILTQEAKPIIKDIKNNVFNISKDTLNISVDTSFYSTYRISDVYDDSLFLKVLPDTGLNNNIFDTTQFKTSWFLNDSSKLAFNINGLNTKGRKEYNLTFRWNLDSTDIKKTPYKFKLIVYDKACPSPLSDTLDVELSIQGQCFQKNTIDLIACDSLVDFKGRVFYNDATTIDTVSSYIGCDKIIIQNIKINKSPSLTYITNTACDSVLALDGNVYFSDTTIYKVYQNSNTCDSIVSQKLVINKSITLPIRGINQITDININYYYAVDSIYNLNYSWEVFNGQIISGSNTNLVEVKWNGSGNLKCYTYYDSSCVKSSNFDVNMFVGIDNQKNSAVKIYPNPTNGNLFIHKTNNSEEQKITLYDIQGKLILEKYFRDKTELDVSDFKTGVYLIRVNDHTYKLLKL